MSDRPNIPFHMHIYTKPLKGGRYLYHILNDCTGDPSDCEQNWYQKLNRDHDINFWKQIYKINFFTIYDNSFIWFQYRIIRRILGTQEFLHKIKQSDSDICRLCGQCCETITHLFVVCNRVNSLWNNKTLSLSQLQNWLPLLQMPWLVVVWSIATLYLWVCHVLISTRCRVFKILLHILSQIIESVLMLQPSLRDSTGWVPTTAVF